LKKRRLKIKEMGMIIMKNKLILFTLFLIAIFPAIAQNNENILKYLDDGGIATSKYMGKINLTSLYEGEISLSVERRFGDNAALEAGAGLLLPCYKDPVFYDLLTNPAPENFTFNNPKTGYSFMINPKCFADEWESLYCALPLRYRIYPGQIHLFDVSINLGYQKVWDNGLVLDMSAGIGVTLQMSKDGHSYIFDAGSKTDIDWESSGIIPGDGIENSEPDKVRVLLPVSVKVGYRFKSR
jgi:hypothetical protein